MNTISHPKSTTMWIVAPILVICCASAPAQNVAPPAPPQNQFQDPPLLPSQLKDPPVLLSDPPIRPSDPPLRPSDPPALPPKAGITASPQAAPGVIGDAPMLGSQPVVAGNAILTAQKDLLASPELVIDAGGFLGSVSDVAISADNRLVAACGDKLVRIIDAVTGQTLHTLRGDRLRTSEGDINALAFSPDGQFLLVGVHDDHAHGSIRVYRTDHFGQIHQLVPGLDSPCLQLAFSRDGRYLATTDGDGQISIWDWPARRILKTIPSRSPDKPIIDALEFGNTEPYLMCIDSYGPLIYRIPDGKRMSVQEYIPPKLLGWMADILQQKTEWPFPVKDSPRTFDLRLDANLWAGAGMGTSNGSSRPWVALWRAREMTQTVHKNQPTLNYTKHRWEVSALAISPNKDFVVSADKFGEVHIWDASTGKTRHKITSQGLPIYQAAFSNSDDQIIYGTRPNLAKWNINNYGLITNVLDLKQRTIRRQAADVPFNDETKAINGTAVRSQPPAAGQQNHHFVFTGPSGQTKYRLQSGRVPSCYTLLDSEQLGVKSPVLFADNLGFLAMWNSSGDELRRAYRGHQSMVTSISPANNHKIFVTGSTDRTMRVWSLLNHKPTGIFDFKYENSTVIAVTPGTSSAAAGVQVGDRFDTVDGHTLDDVFQMMLYGTFAYQPGQMVPVVMKRGNQPFTYQMKLLDGFDYVEPLLNVFIGDNDQWIIWTPQGYYDCSPGADQLIGWHVNQGPDKAAKFYRAQQFRKQLYRPDIINKIIETGVVSQAEQIANSQQKRKPPAISLQDRDLFDANQPPTAQIISPAGGQTFVDPRVTVEATISASNSLPITSVTLLHNGTPAKVFRPSGNEQAQTFTISHRLRLFPGRNEVSFIAENSSATSAAVDCRVVMNSPATENKSKVWVLAMGIGEYANHGNGVENLKFAAADAVAFDAAVHKHGDGRLYTNVESKLLLNDQATRENVLDGLQWLVDNVQQGDVVMLFCSGHGFLDDRDNFYLGSHEVVPDKLRSSAVSWREVIGILHEELPACKRLVFLDACHAAGIGSPGSQNPLHDLAAPELGTIFYASCTIQQKSYERDEWRHGAFTKAILDVLSDSGADVSPRTGDGLVSTVELALGLSDKVRTMTGDRQEPVIYSPDRLKRLNILEFEK